MKYHAFYVNGNLLIRIKNKECTSFKKEKEISVLYNGSDVIGYNIFNFADENINEYQTFEFEGVKAKTNLIKLNEKVNEDINKRLKEINQEALELDNEVYFVVGYVKDINKHPKSDKLNICNVDVKNEELQIICGAPNVDKDQYVVVSKVGAVLPNGTWIKKGKLIGEESNGMICSKKDLGLTNISQGIIVLDNNYEVGASFFNEN
ncbi:tRNA-binding protein [Bacilli bacterium PM5-9]|nr:tRNA-binding protein [Bacilli bacterium PM5-9]